MVVLSVSDKERDTKDSDSPDPSPADSCGHHLPGWYDISRCDTEYRKVHAALVLFLPQASHRPMTERNRQTSATCLVTGNPPNVGSTHPIEWTKL